MRLSMAPFAHPKPGFLQPGSHTPDSCTIVAISRRRVVVPSPSPDRILLLALFLTRAKRRAGSLPHTEHLQTATHV
jgi:hypothetical protein